MSIPFHIFSEFMIFSVPERMRYHKRDNPSDVKMALVEPRA